MDNNKLTYKQDAFLGLKIEKKPDTFNKSNLAHRMNVGSKCNAVRSVNITPDNRYLIVTNDENSEIRVIDLALLEYNPNSFNGHKSSVRLTSITEDGSAFYTASWDGGCNRYEIDTGNCISILDPCGMPKPSCYISKDEKYLFTANYETVHGLNNSNRGRCIELSSNKTYEYLHKNRIKYAGSMDIAFDGNYVFTGSDDGTAHKWSLKRQKSLFQFFDLPISVRKIAVSKRYFASGCSDGVVRVYNKTTGKEYLQIVHSSPYEILDIRISKDETRLVSASSDGTIACFNLKSGKTIFHDKIHYGIVWSICLYNNDQNIVSGSTDGTITFMSINGDFLARYYNLNDTDFLISCPPGKDKLFPKGCFYTTNNNLIDVKMFDQSKSAQTSLPKNDSIRLDYINKLNRKNIIISKLVNRKNYEVLSDNYQKHKKLLNGLNNQKEIRLLNT